MAVEKSGKRPNVEHYNESAGLLQDFFEYRKAKVPGYNFQKLCLDSGLSLGMVNMLVNGKKPLKAKHVEPIAQALKFQEREVDFLFKLVALEQSENAEQRADALRELAKRGEFREFFQIDRGQIEYFSRWYIGVVLALVDHPEFRPDEAWISATLLPALTPREIRHALDILVELNLVAIDDDGKWHRCEKTISTPDEFASEILKSYHDQRLELARWGLEQLQRDQRNFGGLTAMVDEQTFDKVRDYMHDVRLQLVDMLNETKLEAADRVMLVNWQALMVAQVLSGPDSGPNEEGEQ